jgi:hypothetical protein
MNEQPIRLRLGMKGAVGVLLILAFAAVRAGGAEDLKHEGGVAANSNLVRAAVPQLSASPAVITGAVMVENPSWPAAPPPDRVAHRTPEAAERRRTMLMVVLVLAVVGGSWLLRRLRSGSDPS